MFATAACISLVCSGYMPPHHLSQLHRPGRLHSCPKLKGIFPIFQASGTKTTSLPLNFRKIPALKPTLKQFENVFVPLSWLPRKRRTSKEKQKRRRYLRRRNRKLKEASIQASYERKQRKKKEKGNTNHICLWTKTMSSIFSLIGALS